MPRNAAGVYTLPNPDVVTDTTILSSDENVTRHDLESEMTNSLSRSGQGGMLAPFKIADGLVATPGLAFLNDVDSGIYRTAADTWHLGAGANLAATVNQFGFGVALGVASAASRFAVSANPVQIGANSTLATVSGAHTLNAANAFSWQGLIVANNLDQAGFNATTAGRGGLTGIFITSAVAGGAGVVTRAVGIFNNIRNTGAGTVSELIGYAYIPTNAGVVTGSKGFLVENHGVGSTLNAGLVGELASAVNRWNLYMSGTAPNFVNGVLSLASSTLGPIDVNQPGLQVFSSASWAASFGRFIGNSAGVNVYFAKSRGANWGDYATALSNNDDIALLNFSGSDGVQLTKAAQILVEVDNVVAAGQVPGRISFLTANAAGVLTEAMRITSGNNVGINGFNGTGAPQGVLVMGEALANPSNVAAGFLQIYGSVGGAGSTKLSWRQPHAIVGAAPAAANRAVRMVINGSSYDLALTFISTP